MSQHRHPLLRWASAATRSLAPAVAQVVRALRRAARPAVRWGGLRRVTPIARKFGFDRGTPVDRVYIDDFLAAHRGEVRGRVLEIADAAYTRRFGDDRVTRSDVLHVTAGHPGATLVGDLVSGAGVPRGAFDCLILTQTLPFVYDVPAALATCHAALRPGGVMLATVPGISQISRYDMDRWGDYWRFTSLSARRLVAGVFGEDRVTVTAYGNVLATIALLHGLAAEELRPAELAARDDDYEVLIGVRAVKAL